MATPKTKSATSQLPARGSKPPTLSVIGEPNKTDDQIISEHALGGVVGSALLAQALSRRQFADRLTFEGTFDALTAITRDVRAGNLAAAESLLIQQSVVLNAVFTELATRSQLNLGNNLDLAERYMRLALKAQNQCRATVETLAAVKNPPVVFAKQANFAQGHQQVNNGVTPPTPTHAATSEPGTTELLEGNHGQRLDTRTKSASGSADPQLAPVGDIDRPAQRRRQGGVRAQRLPRGKSATDAPSDSGTA